MKQLCALESSNGDDAQVLGKHGQLLILFSSFFVAPITLSVICFLGFQASCRVW